MFAYLISIGMVFPKERLKKLINCNVLNFFPVHEVPVKAFFHQRTEFRFRKNRTKQNFIAKFENLINMLIQEETEQFLHVSFSADWFRNTP